MAHDLLRGIFASFVLAFIILVGTCAAPQVESPEPSALPQTRAERTDYSETSRYADVGAFLDSLQALGAPIHMGSIGTSTEGREIPYVIASRPRVRTPEEARRLDRPIVYVQGNIHGGEVEGKEALQALVRDLVFEPRPNVLDSIVLIAVPIYNVDGNEAFTPQSVNRTRQHGPAMVGERTNAQGFDLNRDYIRAEAPETRGSLRMFNAWDPDVFVDLHATDGSYHGYALTYSPSLNPAAGEAGIFTRDVLLPELRQRMRARHGFAVFDYGNFPDLPGVVAGADTTLPRAWYSYDHRPRYGSNYYGLRGGISILSEAFSHDPFERRVASTYAYVSEILSLAAGRSDALLAVTRDGEPSAEEAVAIRSEITDSPYVGEVIAEELAPDPDSVPDEPGVHPGLRRTGNYRTLRIPVYDRFDPVLTRTPPEAYLLPPTEEDAVELLRLHGIEVERLAEAARVTGEVFVIDSIVRAERPFQGHRAVRLEGNWRPLERIIPDGWYRVPAGQELGTLAVYLLEPETDDGLVTWNFFDGALEEGEEFPVIRVLP